MINRSKINTLAGLLMALILVFPGGCDPPVGIVHYTGKTLSNPDYHHGQLSPAMGVHNIQVMRACREFPEFSDGFGWTYNHAPMLAYWNGKFFLEYLSDSVGEHIPPGQTMLLTSTDGYTWSKPDPVFPKYRIPDGTTKEGVDGIARNLTAVYHQRMGFYVSSANRLLVLAYIGISLNSHDSPNDGKGIGRLVREINPDGSFSPVYFIRYNKAWNAENTAYPFYETSRDGGFVTACNELLENPLMMQQWVEEADRDDPLIPLKKQYKALSFYHLPDRRVAGLWKEGLTSVSEDEGRTWLTPVRAPGIVTSNAKIWGQRTSDGKYATVYNPSDFRWPLAVSVSRDGLEYTNLLLVNGEITTMRYGGNYKSYGPQYVRGILEGNGLPPDGNMWITYSMNKEDIWVSRIRVPIESRAVTHVNDDFSSLPDGKELDLWNLYSPLRAKTVIGQRNGKKILELHDNDEFDYAKAERLFPPSGKTEVEFSVTASRNDCGFLHVELQDHKGTAAIRLVFDIDGLLKMKAGYRMRNITAYQPGTEYRIRITATAANRFYTVYVNDLEGRNGLFFAPVASLERFVFRTGNVRRFPDVDTPTDQDYDVQDPGKIIPETIFCIGYVRTREL